MSTRPAVADARALRVVAVACLALALGACALDFEGLTDGAVSSDGAGGAGAGAAGASSGAAGSSGGGAGGGGAAGSAGAVTGGAAGVAGAGGKAGAGGAGKGGSAGNGGSAGGTSGSAGMGGTAGNGGSAGSAGAAGKGGASGGAGGTSGSAGASGSAGGCSKGIWDDKNCGACGHDCLGGACNGGVCEAVVVWAGDASTGAPATIVADDAHVVWSLPTSGKLMHMPLDAKPLTATVLIDKLAAPRALALDLGELWIAEATRVVRAKATPGALVTEVTKVAAEALALDATNLFWTYAGTAPNYSDGWVGKCNRATGTGSAMLTLGQAEFRAGGIVVDDTYLYWTNTGSLTGPSGVFDGALKKQEKDNAGTINGNPLVTGVPSPTRLVRYETELFYVSENVDAYGVFRVSTGGGLPQKVVNATPTAYPIRGPRGVAVDDVGVYWTNDTGVTSSSSVMACPRATTCSDVVLVGTSPSIGLVKPGAIAVRKHLVFFADQAGGGRLLRWVPLRGRCSTPDRDASPGSRGAPRPRSGDRPSARA